jgi:lysophospholipase L1-like esterase
VPKVAVGLLVAFLALTAACAKSCPSPLSRPTAARETATPPVVADAAAPSARYLALGDSFTIGTGGTPARAFPARLVDRWRGAGCSVALENVAVNGFTTDDVIDAELPSLASFHPTFVTVAVGANDIVRGRSIDAYRTNVGRILDAARASGARVIALPQPDWSRSPSAASFATQPALATAIEAFNAALSTEARKRGAEWADLGALMKEQAATGMLASDGLHPSSAAYDAWASELARTIASPCSRSASHQ